MIHKNIFVAYILLFIKICIIYSQNATINIIAYSFYYDENSVYRALVNGFNEYSIENNLGIYAELTILTPENSTSDFENYGTTIDSLLLRKSEKYDLYFYYSNYSKKYGENFLELEKYLEEEYIKGFDKNLLLKTCSTSDEKIIGLPVYIDVATLYSNQELLTKYEREVPKTWDELISTSRYICDKEKEINNTIMSYNGLFNDVSGSVALYEFINSFRESNDSPHPDIKSKTTIEALEKLKEMKNAIGEESFSASDLDTMIVMLFTGKGLFANGLYMPTLPVFKKTALPGRKEGVSGSVVIPINIAVNKYVSKERRKLALEFMKFIALEETQKKYIIARSSFSGLINLYNDEEVCSIVDCNVIKGAYPFSFVNNDARFFGDDNYHVKYREYLFDYLFHDKPLNEVLKKVDDITRYYTFSLNTEDTNAGLIIFIIFLIISICMLLSLIFIFIKRFENRFKFLSKDLWILTTLGSLILMSSLLTLYGNVTNTSCQLRAALINVGFILSICPSLYKLIINFPESNKISSWFINNKYISILIIMIFTGTLNGILAISSYSPKELTMEDERLFKKCYMKKSFGKTVYYIIQIYDIFIILISLALIFMEWNLKNTRLDVNFLATSLFMDILSIILLNIIDNIKFKEYVIYNVLLAIAILIFSLFNYIFVYFIRVIPMFENNEDSRKILGLASSGPGDTKKQSTKFSTNSNNQYTSYTSESTSKSALVSISGKIMKYHNQSEISVK